MIIRRKGFVNLFEKWGGDYMKVGIRPPSSPGWTEDDLDYPCGNISTGAALQKNIRMMGKIFLSS